MPFERKVLIDNVVYEYHKAMSVISDSEGNRVHICSWEHPEDADNPAKYAKARAFIVPDTQEAAASLIATCENWARDNEYPEYIDEAQAALDAVLPILTDEQAEQVPDAFPQWEPGIAYAVGWRVRFNGVLWKCVQAHTSQEGWEPPVAASLWVRIGEPGEIPEWVQPTGAHDAYAKGDLVRHNEKVWRSLVDGNVWEPGTAGTEALWEEAE